jgi:Holliday junction resolvase
MCLIELKNLVKKLIKNFVKSNMRSGNKRYLKGLAFERKVKKYLENQGYICFHQGRRRFPDLICLHKNKRPLLIECAIRGYFSKEKLFKLGDLAKKSYSIPMIAFLDNKEVKLINLGDYKKYALHS